MRCTMLRFAKTEPADTTNNYDLKIVGDSSEDHVRIEGLRYGNYYLWVTAVGTFTGTAEGGRQVKIKWSERKKKLNIDVLMGY